jgi:serine/threonine protein kinase
MMPTSGKEIQIQIERISNWGYYQISKYTDEFSKINIIQPYCAPEIVSIFNKGQLNIDISSESDLWSLGIILLEYCLGNEIPFDKTFKKAVNGEVTNIYYQIFNFMDYCKGIETQKNEQYEIALNKLKSFPSYVFEIITNCLSIKRNSLDWIISRFESCESEIQYSFKFETSPFLKCLKENLNVPKEESNEEILISNLYKDWKKNREEKKFREDIKKFFPIGKFPTLFLISSVYAANKVVENEEKIFFDVASFNINGNNLTEIIDLIKKENKKEGIENQDDEEEYNVSFSGTYKSFANFTGDLRKKGMHTPPTLSSILLEKDLNLDYQKSRVKKFRNLLINYPTTKHEIIKEANVNIPSVLRGEIWAVILDLDKDLEIKKIYDSIDTVTPHSCDRQISVDVPRCHQYCTYLSSKTGKAKLSRILKAWVIHNENRNVVYWQGVDSLAACLLVLNFHYESRAFGMIFHSIHTSYRMFSFID